MQKKQVKKRNDGHALMKKRRYLPLIICFTLMSLTGCQLLDMGQHDVQPKKVEMVSYAAKVDDFSKRLNEMLNGIGYKYTPGGKPDPFVPIFQSDVTVSTAEVKSKKQSKCLTPLDCIDVGQLTLVAIVTNNYGQRIAMAEDASTLGYVLTEGMSIGSNDGKIVEIAPDRVIVHEKGKDVRGNLATIERNLFLHIKE